MGPLAAPSVFFDGAPVGPVVVLGHHEPRQGKGVDLRRGGGIDVTGDASREQARLSLGVVLCPTAIALTSLSLASVDPIGRRRRVRAAVGTGSALTTPPTDLRIRLIRRSQLVVAHVVSMRHIRCKAKWGRDPVGPSLSNCATTLLSGRAPAR
jgi:hypothetical protein